MLHLPTQSSGKAFSEHVSKSKPLPPQPLETTENLLGCLTHMLVAALELPLPLRESQGLPVVP